jgi:hypothetical protein
MSFSWVPKPDAPKTGGAKKRSASGFLLKRGKAAGTKAGPVFIAVPSTATTPPVALATPAPAPRRAPARKRAATTKLTEREQSIIDYARKKGSSVSSKAAQLYGQSSSWEAITNKIDKDIAITKAVITRKNAAIPFKLTQLTTKPKAKKTK